MNRQSNLQFSSIPPAAPLANSPQEPLDETALHERAFELIAQEPSEADADGPGFDEFLDLNLNVSEV